LAVVPCFISLHLAHSRTSLSSRPDESCVQRNSATGSIAPAARKSAKSPWSCSWASPVSSPPGRVHIFSGLKSDCRSPTCG
jgi:hypothetical protein